jgi:hypothetical protein
MRRQTLLNEARDLLTLFVSRVRGSAILGHTDINKISEGFLVELFREVFEQPNLRDLNQEQQNFPGLDLGDEASGFGYQVTATSDISKVKATIQTVLDAGLESKYPHIRIYVLTEKKASRAQRTIDVIAAGRLHFSLKEHVLDYRDVLRTCGSIEVEHLSRVVGVLKKHLHDPATSGPAPTRPSTPVGHEPVDLNLVPVSFPDTLFIADHVEPPPPSAPARRGRRTRHRRTNPRHLVVQDIMRRGFDAPEDFEVNSDRLISFHDPSEASSSLVPYVDLGTLTPLAPAAYYSTDPDQLNVFKSLLRRALQRQLRPEFIYWQHEVRLFFYAPVKGFETRKVVWKEERSAERVVFQATIKKDKPDEVLTCKHLAFYVDFHLIEGAWYMAIAPTWYFSRDGYKPDGYGAKRISWLKRQEHDQQVHTHFRFICHHLRELQEQSLFDGPHPRTFMRIGDATRFPNHPFLPDHLWNPPGSASDENDAQATMNL